MDATLTPEQQLLRETAADLADRLGTTNPDRIPGDGEVDQQWRAIVDLGLPALRSPALSGAPATGVEVVIVVEELARTGSAVPAVGQAVIVPELLEAAAATDALEAVVAGQLRLAPALTADLLGFATTATDAIAFDTAGATHAAIVDASPGARRVVAVPLPGPSRPGLDLTRHLSSVPAPAASSAVPLGNGVGADRWAKVEALALTAVAADLVGVMQGALDDAVRHVCDRVQFGVPVGSFQAVQHLAADALVRTECARSCVWYAAWAVDRLTAHEALLAARTAKAYASVAGREVVETSVQLFGGIAITWEHSSHVRVRRALLDRRLFGDEGVHHAAIAAARLDDPELA